MQNGQPLSKEIEEKLNDIIKQKTGIEIDRPWKYLQELNCYYNNGSKDIDTDKFEEQGNHIFLVDFEDYRCFLVAYKAGMHERLPMKIDYQL